MLKVPRATKNPLRMVKHALCIETRSATGAGAIGPIGPCLRGAGAFAQHRAGAASQTALNTCIGKP